jgi:SAM-dependent methyltransferase
LLVELTEFVLAHLPGAPARVLEVGCGRGELARALASQGHEVTAIDPQAPPGEIFRSVSLEDFADPGPFEAVLASRSLHHVDDLANALDKIRALLVPAGLVIVNEHAWDRLDEPTARWYLSRHPKPAGSLEAFMREWGRAHADLHGYQAMRSELDRRFVERFFDWVPYLHGELDGADVQAEERRLIDAGAIRATGFRYVGERR